MILQLSSPKSNHYTEFYRDMYNTIGYRSNHLQKPNAVWKRTSFLRDMTQRSVEAQYHFRVWEEHKWGRRFSEVLIRSYHTTLHHISEVLIRSYHTTLHHISEVLIRSYHTTLHHVWSVDMQLSHYTASHLKCWYAAITLHCITPQQTTILTDTGARTSSVNYTSGPKCVIKSSSLFPKVAYKTSDI